MEHFPSQDGTEKEKQRAALREECYRKKLEEEYSFDPGDEMSVDLTDTILAGTLEKIFESKVNTVSDLSSREIYKDEDLLIMKVQETVFGLITSHGTVSFNDVQASIEVEAAMFNIAAPSLIKYALRKGWDESKAIIDGIQQ